MSRIQSSSGSLFRGGLLLALVLCGACSSINPYEKNRELLTSAAKSLAAEQSAQAAQQAERLYAGRSGEAAKFRLQRYFALYLLTEAHVQAAMRQPFLTAASNAGVAARSTIGSARNSDVPHLVAATYYAGLAHDMLASLATEKQEVEGTKLLPPELEAITCQDAQEKLELIRLVALSRLGFAASYQRELQNRPALLQANSCDELIARVGLEKELVPWVYYTIFRHLKDGKEATAYLFGAKARLAAASTPGAIPPERMEEIVDWLREKSKTVIFCCQVCGKQFPLDKLNCVNDPTKITEFRPSSP